MPVCSGNRFPRADIPRRYLRNLKLLCGFETMDSRVRVTFNEGKHLKEQKRNPRGWEKGGTVADSCLSLSLSRARELANLTETPRFAGAEGRGVGGGRGTSGVVSLFLNVRRAFSL